MKLDLEGLYTIESSDCASCFYLVGNFLCIAVATFAFSY